MKKTKNVKATKLMIDDHLKIAGDTYRIYHLNLEFGKTVERVFVNARSCETGQLIHIKVRPDANFTIYNQK